MDPETIAEIVGAIASAIKGMLDASATAKWQKEASGKLDYIIVQNGQILTLLQQLPLLFEADLEKFFSDEVAIQGKSLTDAFDDYMKGHHPDIPQIKNIRTPADLLLTNLIHRGPCIYQAANSVALLVLAIHKVLHVPHNETQGFVDQALAAMTTWAGTNPGMFGKAIIDTQTALTQYMSVLSQEPRGHVVIFQQDVEYHPPGGGGRHGVDAMPPLPKGLSVHPNLFVHLEITADIVIDTTNFTFSLQNARSSYGMDGLHFDDDVVQQKAGEWAQRLQREINNAKTVQGHLDTLQKHEKALQKMIAYLQNWH